MCGLVSTLSWKDPIQPDSIIEGLKALHHRGPDGKNTWISENKKIALGHVRLSIIDIDGGQQPLSNEDNSIHAIVNGEFYGFKEIRAELQNKGHHFKTHSDSEILIHIYEEHGIDCIEHLRGEFAFVLWDNNQQRLFAARDRFGIKPFCYTNSEDKLSIASEAKALFAMGHPARWDNESYFHAANMQYTPQDRTLFKDVFQLKPGHMLLAENGNISTHKYWDMDYPVETNATMSEEEYIEQFHDHFQSSIKDRLVSDVPVCFHLSGGIDSSAVLGIASDISNKPLDAFTVSFEHEGYDEFKLAEEMASKVGANFHPISVTQDDIIDALPDAVYHGEGLAINGHLGAKFLLNKEIRKNGFKVALTGEGADEVLGGYPHLRQDMMAQNSNQSLEELYKTNTASVGVMLAHGAEIDTSAIQNKLGYVPSFLKAKASLGFRMLSISNTEYLNSFTGTDCYKSLINDIAITEQLTGRHIVNQSSYLWTKLALTNYILRTLGDGMEMSASIEGRLPFLDHKLFEFLKSLPMNLKIKNGVEKYILREALKPYISDTIYKRQKHPFMAPPISCYSNTRLDELIDDTINSSSFQSIPFFDTKKLQHKLSNRHIMETNERAAFEPVLMMVLTTALIQERFKL